MTKKCGLQSCQKPLPPGKPRVLFEIRKIPGFTWKFWEFYGGLEFGDINQGVFCTYDHLIEYLREMVEALPAPLPSGASSVPAGSG